MPRRARLVLDGVPLHIIQRGNNKQACFHREADYVAYLSWLEEYARSAGCVIHAYVLMTNHVHLLVSFNSINGPALLMKALDQQYAQYFNWWYERSGTLWEGRYHSSLVADETYFVACQRYIELNPIRAGMVTSPDQYRWSSHRGNIGLLDNRLLTPHALYMGLGSDTKSRARSYRQLFADAISDSALAEIRSAIRTNRAIGSEPVKRGRPPKIQACQ